MGQVISLVNQKGGVSKSTTSVHLSYWLISKKKQKTLLIDADTQRSSSLWVKGMEGIEIPCQVIGSPDDLLEQIPELAADYDLSELLMDQQVYQNLPEQFYSVRIWR